MSNNIVLKKKVIDVMTTGAFSRNIGKVPFFATTEVLSVQSAC